MRSKDRKKSPDLPAYFTKCNLQNVNNITRTHTNTGIHKLNKSDTYGYAGIDSGADQCGITDTLWYVTETTDRYVNISGFDNI